MGRLARSFAATLILWGIAGEAPAQLAPPPFDLPLPPAVDEAKPAPKPSRTFRAVTAKLRATYGSQQPRTLCVAFSPDGKMVASSGTDGVIHLWQAADGKTLRRLATHRGPVRHVAFSADGNFLVSAGADRSVKLWEVKTGKQIWSAVGHGSNVRCAVISPNGKRVASCGVDRYVRLW
ncbi:MAG: hypothetical protein IIA67_05405, partial [Planctomycetes bacterium]|nr:hypothetical protein [Planctomycetota bacterium]